MTKISCLAAACALLALSACAPSHNIRALPHFIEAGLDPGDTVTLTTTEGNEVSGTVTAVRDSVIYLESGEEIPFDNVIELKRRSWKRPAYACGNGKPVGCSVPLLATAISDTMNHYKDTFFDACVEHDFCYRHGAATYDYAREECDDRFRRDMRSMCPKLGALQILTSILDSASSRGSCLAVADQMYLATRKFGDDHFQDTGSTLCEYEAAP